MNGVSIIIPAYNAERTLQECLQSVTTLDWTGKVEVILINDGSTDKTAEIASSFSGIKVINQSRGGAARATNVGIRAARFEIVVLVDTDAVLEPGWLDKILPSFDDPSVAAVSGKAVTANRSCVGKIAGYDVELRLSRIPEDTDQLSTMNTAYRREVLFEVGLLAEELKAGYDVDLSRKLKAAGYRLILKKDARCRHYWKDHFTGYLRQQYDYAFYRMELTRRFRKPYDQVAGLGMILQVPFTVTLLMAAFIGSLASPLILLLLILLPAIHFPGAFHLLIIRKDTCVLLMPLLFTVRNLCWVWAALNWGIRYAVSLYIPRDLPVNSPLTDAAGVNTGGERWRGLLSTSLYTNAYYLVADTAVVSLLGLAFWVLAAKLFTPTQVGLASATVVAVILLARLAGLGFGYGLIRFLPGAGEKTGVLINSGFTATGLISLVAASVFLAGLNLWSPGLLYLRSPALSLFFVLFVMGYTLFLLIEQVFIAVRRAKFVFFKNAAAGTIKIAAVIALVALLSDFSIIVSWGLAIFVSLAIALLWFLPGVKPGFRIIPMINKKAVKDILQFSLGNYLAELLWFAPLALFPLMVINTLGAEINAYFYIAWVIVQMLFAVPMQVAYSLFAEGSHNEGTLRSDTLKSVKLSLVILVPLVIALFVLSDKLLLLLGDAYSDAGTALLRILVISAIPVGINYICLSVLRVKKDTRGVVLISAAIACLALGSGYVLMTGLGLVGIGIAWLATQILVALAAILFVFSGLRTGS